MSAKLNKGLHSKELQPTFDVIDRVRGIMLYNFNQNWVNVEGEDGKKEKQNEYNSLRVSYPVTANTVLETLIREMYPESVEQKLINDYNAAVLEIEPEEKKQPYLDFLNARKTLRAMVDADCAANSIPLE